MSDPPDRIDSWLQGDAKPLAPPPGTFERIRHRAHRRRMRRAVMSAAGVVVLIAAAVAVPPVASQLLHGHGGQPGRPLAEGSPAPSPRSAPSAKREGSVNSQSSKAIPGIGISALSAAGSSIVVPANFRPTSVTFVGPNVGAVIGQALHPGQCATQFCTSLAGTSDYGGHWYGVSAPLTGSPDGAQGVSQLRFLTVRDGWAFGPQLWVTYNGGADWTRESTNGMRVTDLETVGDRAFALFASCSGTGPDYGADCTSFSLYTSLEGSGEWQPVPGPATSLQGTGQAAAASLVLTGGPSGGRGYLLAPSGELLSGPLTGGAWAVVRQQEPCTPGAPGPSGQPTGTLLTAVSAQLIMVCTSATSTSGDTQAKSIMESSDQGVSWSKAGLAPAAGIATSLAAQNQGQQVVLATDAGIYLSGDGGSTWRLVQASPAGAAAGELGFSYVGMTSQLDGVALPADPGLNEVFITTDGGSSWRPHLVSSP
jgi:hypothetical protein